MKTFLVMIVFGAFAAAQACDELPQQQRSAPTVKQEQADLDTLRDALRAEQDFKENGPRLFSMDDALVLSKKTGKPVVCWMGPHIFANAKARAVSRELGETTIQAVMDTDGETHDSSGKPLPLHRVKFSNGSYGKDARVAFIPASKLTTESGKKILAFTRGSK